MVLGASATTGLGLQIVMGTIGFGFMAWGFYSMYINGQFEDERF
jgi:nitrogen fixation-related uncharacterized protein